MTGADLLAMTLRERNVEFVATLCGNGLNPFYVACEEANIRLIDVRNEQAAAYCADAYARLTRRVGVCAVSSGIAHVNALTGITNAWFDGSPVLLITTESPLAETDMGKFQELDHLSLARPVTKYARRVDTPEKMAFYVREALAAATSGRPGPVHLGIPADVMAADIPEQQALRVRPGPGEVIQDAAADPDLVSDAAKLIARAERPVLVAGTGVFVAKGADELEEFARTAAVPTVVPIWDHGAVDRPAEHFLGVTGAASGEPRLLPDADLLLIVGARTDYRLGYGQPPKVADECTIIRIDVDAEELRRGVEPDLKLLGDPCTVLGQLTRALEEQGAAPHAPWLDEARRRHAEFIAPWVAQPPPPTPPMTGRHVVDAIRPHLSDDVVFLVDGGNIGQWAHLALCDRYPGHWLTCGASACVGWGLPGAIGAHMAYPGRPILLLIGDGSFGFTLAELETAVKHGAPFVAVVADDKAWGIVVSGQRKQHGPDGVLASHMAEVRYDQVAEAFGAVGVRAETPEALSNAIAEGLKSEKVTVIHTPIALAGPADE
jgi:acetolactate synthase-1/2/3 large subunit